MRLSLAPMPAWQVDAVALMAGPVRFRAGSGPARCRGMAACLSLRCLHNGFGGLNRSQAWPNVFLMGIGCVSWSLFFFPLNKTFKNNLVPCVCVRVSFFNCKNNRIMVETLKSEEK